jgi:hypothetical protein
MLLLLEVILDDTLEVEEGATVAEVVIGADTLPL